MQVPNKIDWYRGSIFGLAALGFILLVMLPGWSIIWVTPWHLIAVIYYLRHRDQDESIMTDKNVDEFWRDH